MKKWLLACFAMMLPLVVHAWDFCCPTDWCFKLSGGAEALYWKTYTDDFVYGDYTSGRIEKLLALEPEYDWGFRIFATVADKCECNFLDFEWVKIRNSYQETNGEIPNFDLNQNLFVTTSTIDRQTFLNAEQTNHYQKFSAKFGHRFCGNICRHLYGYLGGRWIHINVRQFSEGAGNTTVQVEQKSFFDGGGVEAGIGGYTDLWCGFGTSFRLGGVGAIGDRSYTLHQTFTGFTPGIATLEKITTRCIAALDFRVEANYTYRCDCVWIRAEVGYEQNYYFSPLLFTKGQDLATNLFASDFGIGGLIFGLTVGY